MDYGGHGSEFYTNLVVTKPYGGDCIGTQYCDLSCHLVSFISVTKVHFSIQHS